MTTSIWEGTSSDEPRYPSLAQSMTTDVVIIGGGITGMMAAMLLTKAGKRVLVLEARKIGSGSTGRSTGNLHVLPDIGLHQVSRKWGRDTAAAVVSSRTEALNLVEAVVTDFGLDCAFFRRPHYLLATDASQLESLEVEMAAAVEAGLTAGKSLELRQPLAAQQGVRIEGQAQFHPLRFVQELAGRIASDRCQIFENTPVLEIDERILKVTTARGEIQAEAIIMATHTPKGFNLVQTELGPYREYGIAGRLRTGTLPVGIFWTMEEQSHSLRAFDVAGDSYFLLIGEEHKTGQHDPAVDYFQRLEAYARGQMEISRLDYRWSAQNYRPADSLPYIGHTAASSGVYLATGFGTNGLLYGPLAAMIITDDILHRENRWAPVYRATRFTPVKGAGKFLQENVDVAKQYIRDYLTRAEREELKDVPLGSGRLAEVEGKRLAVYRDEQDGWSAVSPVCTHLGCVVHWNALERSWDCPCHGSRFAADGSVIEGPALLALARKELRLTET